MSQTDSAIAGLLWRYHVCADCDVCKQALAFMEGPICDACLDEDELAPCEDKFVSFRDDGARYERVLRDAEPPRELGSDRLAVDLTTREILFPRGRKAA